MKNLSIAVASLMAIVATGAVAQTQHSGATTKNGVTISHQFVKTHSGEKEVSCRSFAGLEDKFKPEAVAYAIGYNRAKHPEDAVVDVEGINALIPVLVSTCVTTPAQPLHQAVANTLK